MVSLLLCYNSCFLSLSKSYTCSALFEYASTDEIDILIRRHTFKMAAMTSFHAEKSCHLASAHAASARRICSSVRQLLIRSTFVGLLVLTTAVAIERTGRKGGAIAKWSACWTFDPAVGVPVPLAAGGRVATIILCTLGLGLLNPPPLNGR